MTMNMRNPLLAVLAATVSCAALAKLPAMSEIKRDELRLVRSCSQTEGRSHTHAARDSPPTKPKAQATRTSTGPATPLGQPVSGL